MNLNLELKVCKRAAARHGITAEGPIDSCSTAINFGKWFLISHGIGQDNKLKPIQ